MAGMLFLIKYLVDVNQYKTAVTNITFSDIDIKNIPNGVYQGECDENLIYAKVSVTIKGGVITDLKLIEHKMTEALRLKKQ